MKTRLIMSLAIALLLIATLALPAVAAEETEAKTAYVTVNDPEVINISLTDVGTEGIQFGTVISDGSTYGDESQDDGVPAIAVEVETGTSVNVDISIMGSTVGALTIDNWKYSTDFGQSDITGLSGTYDEVYSNQGIGSYAFYHWITVPSGTTATSYTADVTYKVATTAP